MRDIGRFCPRFFELNIHMKIVTLESCNWVYTKTIIPLSVGAQ